MGKIFDALEKFSKEAGPSKTEKLKNSDYEVLMQFDASTGKINMADPEVLKDARGVKRLMTYRLINDDGTLTPAGRAKYEEMTGKSEKNAATDRATIDADELTVKPKEQPNEKVLPEFSNATQSDWALLMNYDRQTGNLLRYDPQSGQLDEDSRNILQDPVTVQRLIDNHMILPGGWLTPEAKQECRRLEKKQTKASENHRGLIAKDKPPTQTVHRPPFAKNVQSVAKIIQATDTSGKMVIREPEKINLKRDVKEAEKHKQVKTEMAEVYDRNKSELYKDVKPTISEEVKNKKQSIVSKRATFTLGKTKLKYDRSKIDKNLVSFLNPQSFEAEQFKILRTNLLFPTSGETPRSLMVTSTAPGEGKSFIAANLAVSVATHINWNVLLVDCDLRRPSVHRQFGFSEVYGLSEYLSKGRELPSLLHKTFIERLTIIPGGKPPSNPSELLSSEKMTAFIEEVSERYSDRLVILDSPPPKLTAESVALARHVDGILLVVNYAKTSRNAAAELINKLGKDKVLGAIVNNFVAGSSWYHKKYYGGGYYGE